MATEAEKNKLQSIRTDLAAVGVDWFIETDGTVARLMASDPFDNEPRHIANLANDLPVPFLNFLMRSAENQALLVNLFDRCRAAYRQLAGTPAKDEPRPNYAAECAMKCKDDRAFRRYLIERHQLAEDSDVEQTKTRVRSVLNVSSMSKLNEDQDAAQRWISLRSDFTAWRAL
jgi:hypothetical protein